MADQPKFNDPNQNLQCEANKKVPIGKVIAGLSTDGKECPDSRDTLDVLFLDIPQESHESSDKNNNVADYHLSSTTSAVETNDRQFSRNFLRSLPRHLSYPPTSGHNNVHFIISTLSGTRAAKPFFERCVDPLLSRLQVKDYDVHETQSENTITDLARKIFLPRANAGVEQTIVLLSGDGGLVDMINALLLKGLDANAAIPTVAILPFGTGNAVFTSTCPADDYTFGLRTLVHGISKPLPTFRVHFSPGSALITDEGRGRAPIPKNHANDHTLFGAVVCSWGLHASLVADSDTAEYRKMGEQRFGKAAQELLDPADGSESHRYQGTVTIVSSYGQETQVIKRSKHMYVLLTLVSHLSKGFDISPKTKPLDGHMRVVHFGELTSSKIKGIFGQAFQGGQHVQDPEVGYEMVDSMRIDFREKEERWRRVCVDGKIIAVEEGGWIQVEREERTVVNLVT